MDDAKRDDLNVASGQHEALPAEMSSGQGPAQGDSSLTGSAQASAASPRLPLRRKLNAAAALDKPQQIHMGKSLKVIFGLILLTICGYFVWPWVTSGLEHLGMEMRPANELYHVRDFNDLDRIPHYATRIKCSAKASQITLSEMRRFEKLEHLDCSGAYLLTAASIAHIGQMESLRHLDLPSSRDWKLDEEACAHLAALKNLRVLTIATETEMEVRAFQYLQPLQNLEVLVVRSDLSDIGMLQDICGFTKLRCLNIRGFDLSRKTGSERHDAIEEFTTKVNEHLSCLASLPDLEVLNPGLIHRLTDTGAENLSKITSLRYLYVDADITIQGLMYISRLVNLEELHLHRNAFESPVPDNGLWVLTPLQKLRALSLNSFSEISGEGLVHLQALPHLQYLSLTSCYKLRARALRHLTTCKQLEFLNLGSCGGLTDEIFVYFAEIPKLKWFHVSTQEKSKRGPGDPSWVEPLLTDDAVEQFLQKHPNVDRHYYFGSPVLSEYQRAYDDGNELGLFER